MKKYALISLSDKTNLEVLVKGLVNNKVEIVATTSTAKTIKELGYDCLLVEDITKYPEMLGGRVKTLQPEIHGGILADLRNKLHLKDLEDHKITPISLVVCNLYPFREVLDDEIKRHLKVLENHNEDVMESAQKIEDNAIENIDIGGVTLIRAASKNYNNVTLLCDPNDYNEYIDRLENDYITIKYNQKQASKGFVHTADYDSMIANFYMAKQSNEDYVVDQLLISEPLKQRLRYGENPQQEAFFFEKVEKSSYSLNTSKIIQGKELSYNNLLDVDAAYNAISEFEQPCAIALKHNTPCGVGFGINALSAYKECYLVDPVSIFGGVVIFNQKVEEDLAIKLNEIFLEIVIAPDFSDKALLEFSKKKNLRVIQGDFNQEDIDNMQVKSINGGYLMQEKMVKEFDCTTVTNNKIDDKIIEQLQSLYKVVKNVKSNAIVIGKDNEIMGISGGMVSRVDAVEFALKNTLNKEGYHKNDILYLASDGFFPFNDIVEIAIENNIKYIIQPGGSLNDEKLIDACNEYNINMIFTNTRFFKH